jgi:hypothetical protein
LKSLDTCHVQPEELRIGFYHGPLIIVPIIEKYFQNSTFFKSTGDGMMIVLSVDESNVKEVVANAVLTSFQLVTDFGSLCKNQPVFNFEVPDRIGIGVARGPATRLESEDKILDYSGNTLNLAARLMDLARPTGVVLDSSVGIELVPREIATKLSKKTGYLRGVAEIDPVTVYYDKQMTDIPETFQLPLEGTWVTEEDTLSLKRFDHIAKEAEKYIFSLKEEPLSADKVTVEVHYGLGKGDYAVDPFKGFEYTKVRGAPEIFIDCNSLAGLVTKRRLPKHVRGFTLVVRYPYRHIKH